MYYLPSLLINLFSGTYIRELGFYVCGKTDAIRTFDLDHEIASIDVVGRHLFLRQKHLHSPSNSPIISAPAKRSKRGKKLDIHRWHRRLGHPSLKTVKQTSNITEGIDLDSGEEDVDLICRPCNMGKAIRTVSRDPQDRPLTPFTELHVDPVGPVSPKGFNGHIHGLMATCACTRARFAYTYKVKEETHTYLTNLIVGIKNYYNVDVKVVRLDGGTEFGGQKWIDFITKRGIQQQPTVPYTPEQDGVSERGFRTVFERARAVAIDQGIPKNLWPELFRGVVYILNRTATSTLKDVTPIEAVNSLLFGDNRRPSMDHLRVLGSKAYVHIPKQRRVQSDKLGDRAVKGILVGFEGNHIYRVYIPGRRGGIVRTSTIEVDEGNDLPDYPDLYEPEDAVEPLYDQDSTLDDDQDDPGLRGVNDYRDIDVNVNDNVNDDDDESIARQLSQDMLGIPQDEDQDEIPDEIVLRRRDRETVNPLPARQSTRSNKGWHSNHYDGSDYVKPTKGRSSHLANTSLFTLPKNLVEVQAFVAKIKADPLEPLTYKAALESHDATEWKKAMEEEIDALLKNRTWKRVKRPDPSLGIRVLRGKWVYKIKRKVDNTIARFKARWVVKGYEQLYGIDYDQTFAGVAKTQTCKILLALAAMLDLEIEQMDAITAFLHGETKDVIYVELPDGYQGDDDHVGLLLRALYGLKQSPRLWQEKLRSELGKLGYKPLQADQCIYTADAGIGGIVVVTYVDDFLLIGPDIKAINKLKLELSRVFSMKDLGPCTTFLGLRLIRDRKQRKIHLV